MPRIALITTSYPAFEGDPCGHFVASEARLLAREGEVIVITAGESGRCASCREQGGVTVVRLDGGDAFGWPGIAARALERPWRLASVALWVHRARTALRRVGAVDRVVAHWAVPSAFPIASAGAPRARLEIVSHGADVRALACLPPIARHALVDRLLTRATSWRFVSRSLHDELAASLGHRDRLRLRRLARIAPATIDLPDVRARSAELRSRCGGAPVRVLVGRLVRDKRFDAALDALADPARIGGEGERRPVVVVVGDGPERSRLEMRARALGLDARFVGRTSREEALAWIGASDALVHASRVEGLSTVLREAEALGVPAEIVP